MKLFELLASFSSEELRGAKKAVQSPLLTTNQRIEQLFDVLRKQHPNFRETEDYKKKLFKKIFPTAKYNDYKLRRLFTELREVLEDYLLYGKIKKDSHRRDVTLTKIYGERNLYEIYEKKTEQLVQKIEENPFPDHQLLLDKAVLMKDFYGHNGTSKLQKYAYLVKAMDAMHLYYMGERMTTKLTYQTLNKTWSKPLALPFEKELEFLETRFTEEESLNHLLYAKIWKLIETNDEELYKETSRLFEMNIEQLAKTDRDAILRSLINYCVIKINYGNKYFSNHLFDLYRKGLEAKFFLDENGAIDQVIYKNIAMLAIQVGEFEWAEQFILNYAVFVNDNYQEEIKKLSLGFLYFYQKDFDKSIETLLNVKFKNVDDIFNSKGLLLRAYFEAFLQNESYYLLFQANNNAFYKYIKRSNVSEDKKERHLNFVSFIKKVAAEIEIGNNIILNINQWKAELSGIKNFAFRIWCDKKLHDLKTRK